MLKPDGNILLRWWKMKMKIDIGYNLTFLIGLAILILPFILLITCK